MNAGLCRVVMLAACVPCLTLVSAVVQSTQDGLDEYLAERLDESWQQDKSTLPWYPEVSSDGVDRDPKEHVNVRQQGMQGGDTGGISSWSGSEAMGTAGARIEDLGQALSLLDLMVQNYIY